MVGSEAEARALIAAGRGSNRIRPGERYGEPQWETFTEANGQHSVRVLVPVLDQEGAWVRKIPADELEG